ncbi:MAG: POTRA domain-containing protein [Myxococcaceae bacterium]
MKRSAVLTALAWLAGCATASTTTTAAPPPPPAPVELKCPTALSTTLTGNAIALEGAAVDKVCLVGASDDTYLRLHELVAPREGSPLAAATTRDDLLALFDTQLLKNAVAVADKLPNGHVMLTYFVTEQDVVTKVSLEGAPSLPPELQKQLQVHGFRATAAQRARLTTEASGWYEEAGFNHATVEVTAKNTAPGACELVVNVVEGPRQTLHAVRFEGLKRVAAADLQKEMKSKIGAPVVPALLEVDAFRMTAVYYDRGMVNVNFEQKQVELDTPPGAVDVVFTVTEGDVYKIGALTFTGFSLGDDKDLLKTFESKKGTVFSRAALQRDMERIKDRAKKKGAVVEVTPLTNIEKDKKSIDVTFELEKKPGPIQF